MFGWLLQNPIANMPGPWFLLLYAVVAVCGLVAAAIVILLSDPTRDREDLSIPEPLDPYEIAFLRGGNPEVTRLAVFDLLQRGVIELADRKKFLGFLPQGKQLQLGSAPKESLGDNALLLNAAGWFESARNPFDIYAASNSLAKRMEAFSNQFEARLKEKELLESEEQRSLRATVCVSLIIGFVALSAYKITAALMTGHFNILFLIFFTIVSIVATVAVCRKRRLSHLGRRYLKQLQLAFHALKAAGKQHRNGAIDKESEVASHPNPALLMAMGIFGIVVLKESAFADFYQTYQRAQSTASGCGSGCGAGGGCGGGGCGGGCGGGGCGGCGGG